MTSKFHQHLEPSFCQLPNILKSTDVSMKLSPYTIRSKKTQHLQNRFSHIYIYQNTTHYKSN